MALFNRSSLDPSDDAQLKLSKEEKAALVTLDARAKAILHKKVELLRKIAKRQGVTAEKLEDLKSKSGLPFVEEKNGSLCLGESYIRAVIQEKNSIGLHIPEVAYLCRSPYIKEDPDSCGWVRGSPKSASYDNIGFLSGSAGVEYYCKICGKLIGKDVHRRS